MTMTRTTSTPFPLHCLLLAIVLFTMASIVTQEQSMFLAQDPALRTPNVDSMLSRGITPTRSSPMVDEVDQQRTSRMPEVIRSSHNNSSNVNVNLDVNVDVNVDVDVDVDTQPKLLLRGRLRLQIPNVLIAGVQKGGTTTTFDYLVSKNNKGFCKPKRFRGEAAFMKKEVHFFDMDERFQQGLSFYAKRYEHCSQQESASSFFIDGTPDYFNVPERVYQIYQQQQQQVGGPQPLDSLKIILSLREPVSREVSWYNHQKRLERWHHAIQNAEDGSLMTFDQYVDKVLLLPNHESSTILSDNSYGMYGNILPRWFDLFDRRRQILIVSFEESQSDPEGYLRRIHEFLGLEILGPLSFGERTFSAQVVPQGNKSQNQSDIPSCQAQNKLWQVFEPSNRKLYDLLAQHPGPSMEQRPFPKFSNPCQLLN
jgi:hypothetical protein